MNPTFAITSTPLPPPPPASPPPHQGTTTSSSSSGSSTAAAAAIAGRKCDPKFTIWTTVTSNGARLCVPDSGVALTVPHGAVAPGTKADIFVSVLHSGQHGPRLRASRETLLSPVVMCGPPDALAHLQKPAVLTLPHCASLMKGNWSVTVMTDAAEDNSNVSSWRRLVTLGQETINTPVYAQLDVSSCHLVVDTLATYCLVGESAAAARQQQTMNQQQPLAAVSSYNGSGGSGSGPAVKCLRLAAYAQECPHPTDLTLRVYCLPDTDDALAWVTESERRFGGRLLDLLENSWVS